MGYLTRDGRWADTELFGPITGAINSQTWSTPATEFGSRGIARGVLTVTALTGNVPTLDLKFETSATGLAGTWYTPTGGTFTQVTGATGLPYTERKVAPIDRFVRMTYALGETLEIGTITRIGGAGVLGASGTPASTERSAQYLVRVHTAGTGNVGNTTFDWSRDGGATFEESDVVTDNAYVLGTTGITIDFPDTGMTVAHSWTWLTTGQSAAVIELSAEAV